MIDPVQLRAAVEVLIAKVNNPDIRHLESSGFIYDDATTYANSDEPRIPTLEYVGHLICVRSQDDLPFYVCIQFDPDPLGPIGPHIQERFDIALTSLLAYVHDFERWPIGFKHPTSSGEAA